MGRMRQGLSEDRCSFSNMVASTYDCVIAFSEISGDLEYVFHSTLIYRTKAEIGPSESVYGWDEGYTKEHYIEDIKYLSARVLCWPRVPELLQYGRKFDLINKLDSIASRITKTHRPRSILLSGEDERPPRGWVIKRERSDGARHVHFPKNGKATVTIKRQSDHRWIAQEFMPLLRVFGELRVICVNKELLYTMMTIPKNESGQWVWSLYNHPNNLRLSL